jgi:hypothetical protein
MRRPKHAVQRLRFSAANPTEFAGMSSALARAMANPSTAWTIPFHVIMWTTMSVGLIMVMVVCLMHC